MNGSIPKIEGFIGQMITKCLQKDPESRPDATRDLEADPVINSLAEQMFYVEPKGAPK
jgi:hypothetical protein